MNRPFPEIIHFKLQFETFITIFIKDIRKFKKSTSTDHLRIAIRKFLSLKKLNENEVELEKKSLPCLGFCLKNDDSFESHLTIHKT